jgi:hypothetical protein
LSKLQLFIRRANNLLTSGRSTKVACPDKLEDQILFDYLKSKRIFTAGKIGTAEILGLEFHNRRIRWPVAALSWRRPAARLANNAGFFPIEKKHFKGWDKIMRKSVENLNFVCLWQKDPFLRVYESNLVRLLAPNAHHIQMSSLGKNILPDLDGYKILVISPFVSTMQHQIPKLKKIHDPEDLKKINWDGIASNICFLRCPFQWHLEQSPFASWEDGLNKLTELALSKKFDIALIGAGAWSIPLGSAVKKAGRSAIHTGGETQLLFGIQGKRWDSYGFYNSSWTSCLPEETPMGTNKIDSGCYW